MTTLKDTPIRIPDEWSATWFRQFVAEVLDLADYRRYGAPDVAGEIGTHNVDPFAHEQMVTIHNIDGDAHPAAFDLHEADATDVHAAADYAQTDVAETITQPWNFDEAVTFDKKVEVYAGQGGGWRDMLGSPVARKAVGVGVPVWTIWTAGSPFFSYKFAVGDSLQFVYHLQHDYSPGTGIFLHTHWITDGTSTGLVKWQFDWTFAKGFNQGSASNFSTSGSTTDVEQAGSGTAFRHMTSEIATAISDADFEVDGLLIVNITRVASSSGSNADSVFLVTADCHYQCNTFNTKSRAPDFYA